MGEAFFEQVFEDMFDFVGTADHAYVPGVGFEGRAQGIFIQVVSSGDDDDPGCFVRLQLADSLRDVAKCQLYFFVEGEGIGEVTAIIYDDDAEIELSCQARECLGDVTGSGEDEARLWAQHFYEDFQGGATTSYGFALVGVQVEVVNVGPALL